MSGEIITTKEVAALLGIPKRTLSWWITKGKFLAPQRDDRGYYFWDKEELKLYLALEWAKNNPPKGDWVEVLKNNLPSDMLKDFLESSGAKVKFVDCKVVDDKC